MSEGPDEIRVLSAGPEKIRVPEGQLNAGPDEIRVKKRRMPQMSPERTNVGKAGFNPQNVIGSPPVCF
jgi:hypothetical protein